MNILIKNTHKCEIFSSVFQYMKLFSENVNISFSENRLFLQAMDSSHISIIELSIPSDWFDTYEHTDNPNVTIGVNTVILFKILSTREKTQTIQIKYSSDDSDKMYVDFKSDNKTVFDKHFEVPLMELDTEIMDIPKMEHQAEFILPSAYFASLVSNLKMFGDTLDVECSEEKITLYSHSQNTGKMSVNINIDELSSFMIDEGENLKLSFSLNNLYNMAQFHKISNEVEVKLNRDFPMNITFRLGDENATLSMYLAPKISEDD